MVEAELMDDVVTVTKNSDGVSYTLVLKVRRDDLERALRNSDGDSYEVDFVLDGCTGYELDEITWAIENAR